jgi:hypothetical protein
MKSILQSKTLYAVAVIGIVFTLSLDALAQSDRDSDRSVRSREEKTTSNRQNEKDTTQSVVKQKTQIRSQNKSMKINGVTTNAETIISAYDAFTEFVDNPANCNLYHYLSPAEFNRAADIFALLEAEKGGNANIQAALTAYGDYTGLAKKRARIISGKENSYADVLAADLKISKSEAQKIVKRATKEK